MYLCIFLCTVSVIRLCMSVILKNLRLEFWLFILIDKGRLHWSGVPKIASFWDQNILGFIIIFYFLLKLTTTRSFGWFILEKDIKYITGNDIEVQFFVFFQLLNKKWKRIQLSSFYRLMSMSKIVTNVRAMALNLNATPQRRSSKQGK